MISTTNTEYRTIWMHDPRWYYYQVCHNFVEKAKNTAGTDYKNPFTLFIMSEISLLGHFKWIDHRKQVQICLTRSINSGLKCRETRLGEKNPCK